MKILLVEPNYRSKFPPLGLMRLSSYYKDRGDNVTFCRGHLPEYRDQMWDRIFISSLFTWNLPETVKTINYYGRSVESKSDIVVGGIAATLFPDYIRTNAECTIVEGVLNSRRAFPGSSKKIADYVPDYSLLKNTEYRYNPADAFFCRATRGCIRKCKFCAVPILEPVFEECISLKTQVTRIRKRFGEKQNLVVLDNNILASENIARIIDEIKNIGFFRDSYRKGKRRWVDFNQGIDARFIDEPMARKLHEICLDPIRLAFDSSGMKKSLVSAVKLLARAGFSEFTTYLLYNYKDTPDNFYNRMSANVALSTEYGVRVSGFPMRYVPMRDVKRRHISKAWAWRELRGVQCVLNATRGLISPNEPFFQAAFGSSATEFKDIISMPDRYIIYRKMHLSDARAYVRLLQKLTKNARVEFLRTLETVHLAKNRKKELGKRGRFSALLEHHYPDV